MRIFASLTASLMTALVVVNFSPSDAQAQLSYKPITPCRVFDTAKADPLFPLPPFGPGFRDFQVSGSGPFEEQGGTPGGCGVPSHATVVMVSISARATAEGRLAVYTPPTVSPPPPPPLVNALSYAPNVTATSSVTVGLDARQMRVFSTARARVWADVIGYFEPPIQVYVSANGVAFGKSRVSRVEREGVGQYRVFTDRQLADCLILVSVNGGLSISGSLGIAFGVDTYTVQTNTSGIATVKAADLPFTARASCP